MVLGLAGEKQHRPESPMCSVLSLLPLPLQLGRAITHQGWQRRGLSALGTVLHRAPVALTLLLDLLLAAHYSHPVREHTADWQRE